MGRRHRRLTTADWFGTLIVFLLLPALSIPMLISAAAGPTLGIAGGPVVPGQRVTIVGERFDPRSSGALELGDLRVVARYNVDRRGTFETTFRVPKSLPPGSHTLIARSGSVTVASLVLLSAALAAQGAPVGASTGDSTPAASAKELAEVASVTSIAVPTQAPTPSPLPTPELIPTLAPLPTPAPVVTPTPVFVPVPVVTPAPGSTPTGPGTAPPPASAGVAVTFGPTATAGQLVAAISDNSIDTIFLQPGTYHVGKLEIRASRSRPVTVRPASGGVVFNGNSVPGAQSVFAAFRGAANITFAGFTVTNYGPIGTGVIVLTDGAHHITFSGLTMAGNRMTGGNDHLIYPAGYSAAVHDITIQNSILDGATGGAVHIYHEPGAVNIRVLNNRITNNTWGVIAAATGSTVTVAGNTFSGNNYNMIAYPGTTITASGNAPSNAVTPW